MLVWGVIIGELVFPPRFSRFSRVMKFVSTYAGMLSHVVGVNRGQKSWKAYVSIHSHIWKKKKKNWKIGKIRTKGSFENNGLGTPAVVVTVNY